MDPRWLFGIVSNNRSTPEIGLLPPKGHESSSKFINFRCELLGYINLPVKNLTRCCAPWKAIKQEPCRKICWKTLCRTLIYWMQLYKLLILWVINFLLAGFFRTSKLWPPSSGRDRALDEENRNYKFENATWFGPISACSAFHLCLNRLCWKWMSQWEQNWTSVRVFCLKKRKVWSIFFGWSDWPFLCGGVVGGKKSSNLFRENDEVWSWFQGVPD